jgi:hypothetical protein
MTEVAVLPAIPNARRSLDPSRITPTEPVTQQSRKVRAGPNGQAEPAEQPRVEVDRRKPSAAELQQLELEDSLEADGPE